MTDLDVILLYIAGSLAILLIQGLVRKDKSVLARFKDHMAKVRLGKKRRQGGGMQIHYDRRKRVLVVTLYGRAWTGRVRYMAAQASLDQILKGVPVKVLEKVAARMRKDQRVAKAAKKIIGVES